MELVPSLSIVVPVYNQSRLLLRLLESLAAMDNASQVEVIVVDDKSTDDTVAATREWLRTPRPFTGQLIEMERNGGPGKARNAGARAARAEVVAFTDSDCVVAPGWANALLRAMAPESGIVGVGGKVLALSMESIFARYNVYNRSLEPQRSPWYPIPFLITCNCCYLKSALLEVGGFAEYIPHPGGEDIAASILIYKAGGRFAYADDALVYHDFRDSVRNFIKTWRNYGYGCGYVTQYLLSEEELRPEYYPLDTARHWSVDYCRPTVTGLRSFFKDQRRFRRFTREQEIPWWEIQKAAIVRLMDRIPFHRGWREGTEAAMRARGASQKPGAAC